jgi:transposase InsO family protein
MEEVVKLFSMVFGQISALQVVDKFVLSSLTNELTMAETTVPLEKQKRLPNVVLSDHGGQFKEQWKKWCSEPRIDPHFELPSYSQDKRKIERCVQNLNREFVDHR